MESNTVNHRMITRSKMIEDFDKPVTKDSTKRYAEPPYPDRRQSKKRILGDITNQTKITNAKSNVNVRKGLKNTRYNSENSVLTISDGDLCKVSNPVIEQEAFSRKRSLSEKTLVPERSVSQASSVSENVSERESLKSKASVEDSMYTTALDESIESPTVAVHKQQSLKVVPEGVEDFDKSCLKDPFSESRYAADIFAYYLEREKLFPVKKYLHLQKDMTKGMRAILVDWMVEVQESFELNHETLYLAVKLVDRYLSKNRVPKSYLQLIGATAICIAAKFDERQPPLVDDFLYICDDSYTREQLIETEIKMLQTVDFDLGIPLSYRFLRRFARCAKLSLDKLTLARYILETALMDYELIDVLDSKLAAGALLLALKMKNQKWTPTYEFYTGYKEEDLKDILYALNKNISTPIHNMQTIRTKYSHQVFFEVSKVPPLGLPK